MLPENVKEHVMTYHQGDLSALDRFEMIARIIADNEVACSLIEKLMHSAERYFCKVFEMEAKLKVQRLRLDGNELRELTENLDKSRHTSHEALISDLHIFNRYILKEYGDELPIGGIFSKAPEAIHNRIAVADWAGELLTAVYQNRKR